MENTVTFTEKTNAVKDDTITIRPYFNPNIENMGLEKYSMTLHEGVKHTESVTCLERNGIRRYITGLNEFSPEIKKLPPKEKAAKVKEIREIVCQLEKELATNIIDLNDPEFWSKVKVVRPDNDDFWEKLSISVGNDPIFLDPSADPYDLLKLYAIRAGGFSLVAPSLEAAKLDGKYKFYLDERKETIQERTKVSKVRNKALGILSDLYDTDKTKLLYITKLLDYNSTQYTDSTPIDVLYEVMDLYVIGDGAEKSSEKASKLFIKSSKTSNKDLQLQVLVKDLLAANVFTTKSDGYIYHRDTGAKISTTKEGVVEYLKNPKNDEILKSCKEEFDYLMTM